MYLELYTGSNTVKGQLAWYTIEFIAKKSK